MFTESWGLGCSNQPTSSASPIELKSRGVSFQQQAPAPVHYKNLTLECGYRIDLVIEDRLILEIKSVDRYLPIHEAQLLTYMKLAGIRHGLLMNFNVTRLKDGLKSLIL